MTGSSMTVMFRYSQGSALQCVMPALNDTNSEGNPLPIYLIFGGDMFDTGHSFTYKGNPVLTKVEPLDTILR